MAGFDITDFITSDNRALVCEKLRELPAILKILSGKHILNREMHEKILNTDGSLARIVLLVEIINRRGETAYQVFLDSLITTGQVDLAKALKPGMKLDDSVLRNSKKQNADGNCVSGENEGEMSLILNLGGEQGTGDAAAGSIQITPPSQEAIEQNENFYRIEKAVFTDVPATDGFLSSHLKVKYCDKFPDDFKDTDSYKNFTKPKGLALIFNIRFKKQQQRYGEQSRWPERLGTDVDCQNLKWLLENMGYQVKVKNDLTAKEILDSMMRFASKSEHDYCDSAVVAVMTHGERRCIIGSDGKPIEIDSFVQFLDNVRCPALRGKPKLFIIQACRGETYDEGVDGPIADDVQSALHRLQLQKRLADRDEADARAIEKKLPTGTDVIIAYATTPGYVSWRNTVRGSWFIQAICEVFSAEAWHEDILHLLTKVNAHVANQMSGCGRKQVPEPAYRLTKKFYFFPGVFNRLH